MILKSVFVTGVSLAQEGIGVLDIVCLNVLRNQLSDEVKEHCKLIGVQIVAQERAYSAAA